ncbi:F-box protein [Melia azedarach]|uniref:F-box protein n=1 Tax=Melia azedarach TaxID=155640 RepID=A0ACC1Z2E9_MELAZ|nr:F-box protein [Melia azedarach]
MNFLLFLKMNFSTSKRKGRASEPASKERAEERVANDASMSDLPFPILMDIFSRLPINTILQIRSVCKTWFALLSDPYFAEIHLARAPLSLMILTNFCQMICSNSLEPLYKMNQNQKQNGQNIPGKRFSLLTSCNGLLCSHEFSYKKEVVSICNPILGEYLVLPQLERNRVDRRIRGFGFSQSSKQYKVIQTLNYKNQAVESNNFQVEIHTIGMDTWRNIGDLPYQLIQPYYGALLNGVFHWYAHSHDNKTAFMCSFDLGKEEFQSFPGPPIQGFGKCRPANSISVGVSGGFLYLCDGFLESNFDIWIMKNYGVKESWTKEFVIVNPTISKLQRVFGSMYILNYRENMSKEATEDTELVMLLGSEDLFAYKVTSQAVRKPKSTCIQSNYQAIPYIPSLVSVKMLQRKRVHWGFDLYVTPDSLNF